MQGSFINSTVTRRGHLWRWHCRGRLRRARANGWAVQGGVKINLPMIAAGDDIWFQAAYAKGGSTFTNSGYPGQGSGGAFELRCEHARRL